MSVSIRTSPIPEPWSRPGEPPPVSSGVSRPHVSPDLADSSAGFSFELLCRRPFRVGDFRVDPRSLTVHRLTADRLTDHRLTADRLTDHRLAAHRLEPKILLVLARLAASPGEVVTRDELFAAAWPGVHVGDNVLSRTISELRKLFDDRAARPTAIETIRARGYRLLLPVGVADGAPDEAVGSGPHRVGPPSASSPRTGHRSVAPVAAAVGGLAVVALIGLTSSTRPPATAAAVRPVSAFAGTKWQPRISPDGTSLVVVGRTPEMSADALLVKSVDGGEPEVFGDRPGEEASPAWSPDGREIAFSRRVGEAWHIVAAPRGGGPERRLLVMESGTVNGLDWSPDGQDLVAGLRFGRQLPFVIARLPAAGGEPEVLSRADAGTLGHLDPRYSPDGERIAFVARGLRDQSLAVMRRDGSGYRLVHAGAAGIAGFDWSADGRDLVFSGFLGEVRELWRVPVAGGEPERLQVGGIHAYEPTLSRRGPSRLLVLSGSPDVNLWRQRIGGPATAAEPVTRFTRPSVPRPSNAGDRIAFFRPRGRDSEIVVASRDGGEQLSLGVVPGRVRLLAWSPRDRALAFEVTGETGSDVFVVPADGGGTARPLVTSPRPEIDPSWSADGRFVYFSSFSGEDWLGWKVPAAGGEPVRVGDRPAYRLRESFDGETVYFSALLDAELRAQAVAGGPSRPVTTALSVAVGLWSVWHRGLLLVALEDEHREIYSVLELDPATGESTALTRFQGELAGGEVNVDPEDWLYFVRYEHERAELLLIEGFS